MTKKEKFELLIKKGFIYNPETGVVTNSKGKNYINTNKSGYIVINQSVNYKSYSTYVHQFAWYWVYKEIVECVDHINKIKTDNKISNLRSVSRLQNQWNQKERKGYTYFKRDNNWKAQISIRGKVTHIGYFNTEEEASKAYQEYKQKIKEQIIN